MAQPLTLSALRFRNVVTTPEVVAPPSVPGKPATVTPSSGGGTDLLPMPKGSTTSALTNAQVNRVSSGSSASAKALDAVLDCIKNKYPEVNDCVFRRPSWENKPEEVMATARLFANLGALDTAGRRAVLAAVNQDPPMFASLGRVQDKLLQYIKLACGDLPTWDAFLDEIQHQTADASLVDGPFPAAIAALPEATRKAIVERVVARYGGVRKSVGPFLNGKMAYDVLINRCLKIGDTLIADVQGGMPPQVALARQLKAVGEAFSPAPGGQVRGGHTARQVMDTARAVRDFQVSHPDFFRNVSQQVIDQDKQPVTLTMFGSFPNGRAKPGHSDVDLSVPMELYNRDELQTALRKEVDLKPVIGTGVESDWEVHYPMKDLFKMGSANPVQFLIEKNRVVMRVFRSFTAEECGKDGSLAQANKVYVDFDVTGPSKRG